MRHKFTAQIYKFSSNPSFCCVDAPATVSATFAKRGAVPVTGTVNGCEWRGTLLPNGSGGHRIVLNGQIRKQARVGVGDTVELMLQLDTESRQAAMPPELEAALRENELLDAFNALAAAKRNYMLKWLQEAKSRTTWERRVETLVMRLQNNQLA